MSWVSNVTHWPLVEFCFSIACTILIILHLVKQLFHFLWIICLIVQIFSRFKENVITYPLTFTLFCFVFHLTWIFFIWFTLYLTTTFDLHFDWFCSDRYRSPAGGCSYLPAVQSFIANPPIGRKFQTPRWTYRCWYQIW